MDFSAFYAQCKDIFGRQEGLPVPTELQAKQLWILTERMLETNRHMNLTAITDESAVILKHYADSLTVSTLIPQGASVIDIGCGAGFPTIPLAIFRSDLQMTAVDSTAKRIEYVKGILRELCLDHVTAVAGRAEELAKDPIWRETFDIALARAVASLPVLTELCLPFVKVGGSFIAMKASRAEEEYAMAINARKQCGGGDGVCHSVSLVSCDGTAEPRMLIAIPKKQSTPVRYPRHFSQISKKPL